MAMLIFTQGYVGTVLKLEPKNCQWSLLFRKPIHPWGPCSSMKPFPKWPALSLMKLLYLQTMSWVNIRESRMLLMGSQLDHLHPLKIQGWKPKVTLPFFWGDLIELFPTFPRKSNCSTLLWPSMTLMVFASFCMNHPVQTAYHTDLGSGKFSGHSPTYPLVNPLGNKKFPHLAGIS
jgi:hypothetical protein